MGLKENGEKGVWIWEKGFDSKCLNLEFSVEMIYFFFYL